MREDWKYLPLGEITTSINGLWKGKKPPFVNVGVIRNANFTKEFTLNLSNIEYLDVEERQYSSRKLQRGDLIVEKSGGSEKQPVGRTILFDLEGEYSVSNFTSILRIKDKTSILPTFLYKYLLYIYKEGYTKEMQNATTGIHNIIYDKFLSIPIPILSLSEQERIVALLDDQFAKIDALKANAASQLQAAKDLFQSALKQLLTPQEGWEEKTLGNICISIKDGDWIEKKDQSPTGIRLLQTGNIGVGIYKDKSDSPHYISLDTFNRLHCEEVFAGDILLSRLPEPVGRACLVPKMEGRFITAVDCSIIKINTEKVTPAYLIYYTQTNAYFKSISSLCTGTTRQRISRKKLEEVSISFPSLPEQERIAARLDEISEKVKALQANYDQTINLCNDLKQSLLKSIFA